MPSDARVNIAFTNRVDANSVAVPPPGRITLSTEARRTLLDTGLLALKGTEDTAWPDLEDALLETLMPVRYITGVVPAEQRAIDTELCGRCQVNARYVGDFLCTSCRVKGSPS